jgi:hypothetical protein
VVQQVSPKTYYINVPKSIGNLIHSIDPPSKKNKYPIIRRATSPAEEQGGGA